MDPLVISTAQDVAALAKDARTGKRRRAREIRLRIESLSETEAARLQTALNRHYFACGCAEATAVGLAGLLIAGVVVASPLDGIGPFGWWDSATLVAGFVVGTGVGRAVSRWRANAALRADVEALIAHVPGSDEIGKGDGSARCALG